MKKIILLLGGVLFFATVFSQNVGIGTTSPGAKLDISSTNSGILIPRVALTATSSASPITSPAASTLVYNTATAGSGATAVTPGFYYWNGTAWIRVIDNASLSGSTTVSNSVGGDTLNTTVNGVTGTAVTVPNLYTTDGSLTGDRTVNMGNDDLTFTSSNGVFSFLTIGNGSVAMGNNASAIGANSIAMGYNTTAAGSYSTALGRGTYASGQNSLATGATTSAIGQNSTAMGQGSQTNGQNSSAIGDNVTALSYDEVAIGAYNTPYAATYTGAWAATDRLFGIGNGTSSGSTSDAMVVLKNGNVGIGYSTPSSALQVNGKTSTTNLQMTTGAANGNIMQSDAGGNASWVSPSSIPVTNIYSSNGSLTGDRTVTMGNDDLTFTSTNGVFSFLTIGSGSVAMGNNASAIGTNSTAMGYNTTAAGSYSTAMGRGTYASGQNSLATGATTSAVGQNSTAMGQGSQTNGQNSTAIGDNVTALSYDEVAIGAYNTSYSATYTGAWAATDRLFGIGNGISSGSTSDAMVVLKNGNTGLGTASPAYTLDVNGVINSATGFKVAGGTPGTSTYLKGNGTNFVAGTIAPADLSAAISGTANTVAKFTGANTLGNSTITDNGADLVFSPSGYTLFNTGTVNAANSIIARGGITNDAGNLNLSASTNTIYLNSNVGVGNASPNAPLDVNGNIQISNATIPMGLMTEVGGTTPLLNLDVNFRETNKNTAYEGASFRIDTRSGSPLFNWFSRPAVSGPETDMMVLTASGNLGIGNTSPTDLLDVAGNVGITGSADIGSWASQSIGANGYARMGGVLIQWGSASYSSNNSATVTFPTAFTNIYSVTATVDAGANTGSGANVPCKVMTTTNSSFQFAGTQAFSGDAVSSVRWVAIGN